MIRYARWHALLGSLGVVSRSRTLVQCNDVADAIGLDLSAAGVIITKVKAKMPNQPWNSTKENEAVLVAHLKGTWLSFAQRCETVPQR